MPNVVAYSETTETVNNVLNEQKRKMRRDEPVLD